MDDFRQFFLACSKSERTVLAARAGTTISYLHQICAGRKVSVELAYRLERVSAELARQNKRLKPISGAAIVRNEQRYRDFVALVSGAA